jgi:flagellar protein FliL
MSSAAAPATKAPAGNPPAPVKDKKKLLLIALAVLLLIVLAGGGTTVFVLKQRAAAAQEAGEDGIAAAQGSADKGAHLGPPTFVPLEPFVVNLADKDNERYAQIGLTLEVEDAKFAEEMKLYMPAIRNAILMILAHKQSSELLDRAGKEALAAEIMREAVRPMGIEIEPPSGAARADQPAVHNPVRRVHFASFIVQ